MSWSTPRTWVTGENVTAAIANTHWRDQLLETAPAKLTAAGDIPYASGANALARLPAGANGTYLQMVSGLPAWVTLGANQYKRKTATESVTSSTTLQNDDHFSFAIGASEIWSLRFFIVITGTPSGGFKYAFTVPASAAGVMSSLSIATNVSALSATITTGLSAGITAACAIWLYAIIVNSTNAGTVQFQWAQNASNVSPTTLDTTSFLEYRKVA